MPHPPKAGALHRRSFLNWGGGGRLYLCDLGSDTCYYTDPATAVARGDYAANAGDTYLVPCWVNQPVSYQQGDSQPANSWPTNGTCPIASFTGVCYLRSEVKMAEITDGTSKTYLVGERYLDPDHYFTGVDLADDQCLYVGFDNDSDRSTYLNYGPPAQDQAGYPNEGIFGSAHAVAFNMAFCDGSVTSTNYSINREIHRRLGNRKDGLPIDGKAF